MTESTPIGETIKRLRVEYAVTHDVPRFSQGKLAAALGIDRNTVTGWENGANVPADQRLRLAKFFGVDPAALGVEMAPSVPSAVNLDAVIAKIDELMEGHSPAVGTVPADVKTIQEDVGYIRTRLDTLIAQVEALAAHAGVTVVGSAPAARESRA